MNFFNQEDFDFFSTIRGAKYIPNDPFHIAQHKRLIEESVYAKTNYWASLLKDSGLAVEFSNRWQNSGYYSSYTWAKIYPATSDNNKIFFTIGVGSRFSEPGYPVFTLEMKLDCQRGNSNPLDPSLVYEFDKYMTENCPEASRKRLKLAEIDGQNWSGLITQTISFIAEYKQDYDILAQLTSEIVGNLPKKIVRLCWNENKWTKPSGKEGKSKATGHAFEKDKGYGYEEWLFNPDFEIDGYRYGFIQAFHKGDHRGRKYEVFSYAMKSDNKKSECYWVGRIKCLEVLTSTERIEAVDEFKRRGWLDRMKNELNEVNIDNFDYNPISADDIINVRYKADPFNWVRYDPLISISDPANEVGKNRHYVALPKTTQTSVEDLPVGAYQFQEGHNKVSTDMTSGKRSEGKYHIKLKHKLIQEQIYAQLIEAFAGTKRKVGTENNTGFGTSIDLVVSCPDDGLSFYEIKTCGSAIQCIRDAIGQLFEYNFYFSCNNAKKLVVVGLSKPTDPIYKYMSHLRSTTGVSLFYQYFDEKKSLLTDEIA